MAKCHRQRDGMSKVSENGDSSGSGIVGGRAGRGSGSPKKRKRHSLFDAIKERIRLKKNLSTPGLEEQIFMEK